jgi:hypothetical protein
MRSGSKAVLAVTALGVATLVGYFGYDSYAGKKLVRELCAKDGGVKIYESTFVSGFLDETVADELYCSSCFERLAKHQFEYVDVRVKGDPATAHPLAIQPGYYRFSLAQAGDARCELWSKNVDMKRWATLERQVGVSDAQCVAVEALDGMMDEPMLQHKVNAYSNGGRPSVTVDEWTIRSTTSGQPLTELREYLFYSRWNSLLSAGPMNPSARCSTSGEYSNAMLDLVPRTLKDQSKEISR